MKIAFHTSPMGLRPRLCFGNQTCAQLSLGKNMGVELKIERDRGKIIVVKKPRTKSRKRLDFMVAFRKKGYGSAFDDAGWLIDQLGVTTPIKATTVKWKLDKLGAIIDLHDVLDAITKPEQDELPLLVKATIDLNPKEDTAKRAVRRMTFTEVAKIGALVSQGHTNSQIRKEVGVSLEQVQSVRESLIEPGAKEREAIANVEDGMICLTKALECLRASIKEA